MHAQSAPADETRFLRLPAVLNRVGLGKTKIYDLVKKREFPAAIKLGRASVWVEADVLAWQREKMKIDA